MIAAGLAGLAIYLRRTGALTAVEDHG
jgi:hypothetical protein